jgi:hypothetical protein
MKDYKRYSACWLVNGKQILGGIWNQSADMLSSMHNSFSCATTEIENFLVILVPVICKHNCKMFITHRMQDL